MNTQLDAGLRGRELARAIHEEHARRGIGNSEHAGGPHDGEPAGEGPPGQDGEKGNKGKAPDGDDRGSKGKSGKGGH